MEVNRTVFPVFSCRLELQIRSLKENFLERTISLISATPAETRRAKDRVLCSYRFILYCAKYILRRQVQSVQEAIKIVQTSISWEFLLFRSSCSSISGYTETVIKQDSHQIVFNVFIKYKVFIIIINCKIMTQTY